MKKIIFIIPFLFCSLQAKTIPQQHENLKALLFECIQGNNSSCEKFINSSPQAKQKFQELKSKQWVEHELRGRHIYQMYLKTKKTNCGNKRLIKQIMLHMEHTKMLKSLGKIK
jgi:hypothetical protein